MGTKKLDSSKSLCKLTGKIDDHFKEFTELINKPKYICLKCGRAAVKKKNLCKASKIKID